MSHKSTTLRSDVGHASARQGECNSPAPPRTGPWFDTLRLKHDCEYRQRTRARARTESRPVDAGRTAGARREVYRAGDLFSGSAPAAENRSDRRFAGRVFAESAIARARPAAFRVHPACPAILSCRHKKRVAPPACDVI